MIMILSLLCFYGYDVENVYSILFYIIYEIKICRVFYYEVDKCFKVWYLRMGLIELFCLYMCELKYKKFNYYI